MPLGPGNVGVSRDQTELEQQSCAGLFEADFQCLLFVNGDCFAFTHYLKNFCLLPVAVVQHRPQNYFAACYR